MKSGGGKDLFVSMLSRPFGLFKTFSWKFENLGKFCVLWVKMLALSRKKKKKKSQRKAHKLVATVLELFSSSPWNEQ